MITTRSFIDQTWIDLNSPTKDELDSLVLSRDIDPMVAKDLLTPTPKQHIKEFDDAIYAVIHIPYQKFPYNQFRTRNRHYPHKERYDHYSI